MLGLNLFLQIQVLGLQPIAQAAKLLVGQAVIQRYSHGARNLIERSMAQVPIGSQPGRHEKQCTQAAVTGGQRQRAERFHPVPLHLVEGHRETLTQLVPRRNDEPPPALNHPMAHRAFGGEHRRLRGVGAARREDMTLQPVARDRHLDSKPIRLEDIAQTGGNRTEQLVAFEVPAHRDVDVEKAFQLLLGGPAFGPQPAQFQLGHDLLSEGLESGRLFGREGTRLAIHDADRAQLVTRGRRQRSTRVEPDVRLAAHEETVLETRFAQRVVHDEHIVLSNRIGAQRLRARPLVQRHPDRRLEPLAIRVDQADRRQRRAADLGRQFCQFVEFTLGGRIEDGKPPQGLQPVRFHVGDHEVYSLEYNCYTTSARNRCAAQPEPAVYCFKERRGGVSGGGGTVLSCTRSS